MRYQTLFIRFLMIALLLGTCQSKALDSYWGKWMAGIIGTFGVITTFFKPDIRTVYAIYQASQDKELKEFYKDKKVTWKQAVQGYSALRTSENPLEIMRTPIRIKKAKDSFDNIGNNFNNFLSSRSSTSRSSASAYESAVKDSSYQPQDTTGNLARKPVDIARTYGKAAYESLQYLNYSDLKKAADKLNQRSLKNASRSRGFPHMICREHICRFSSSI